MPARGPVTHARAMTLYLLQHRHAQDECAAAFASWKGFDSPLRESSAWCSCLSGGHQLWFMVEAGDGNAALAHLPRYLAERSEAVRVTKLSLP
jgi:hypothetical protein